MDDRRPRILQRMSYQYYITVIRGPSILLIIAHESDMFRYTSQRGIILNMNIFAVYFIYRMSILKKKNTEENFLLQIYSHHKTHLLRVKEVFVLVLCTKLSKVDLEYLTFFNPKHLFYRLFLFPTQN